MPKIDFLPDNKIFEVEPGETILQTASRNGIPHVNACGGEESVQPVGYLF